MTTLNSAPIWDGYRRGEGCHATPGRSPESPTSRVIAEIGKAQIYREGTRRGEQPRIENRNTAEGGCATRSTPWDVSYKCSGILVDVWGEGRVDWQKGQNCQNRPGQKDLRTRSLPQPSISAFFAGVIPARRAASISPDKGVQT
jgi:hypothetical protein